MLLIYSHKTTPRLTYIMKHIFTRILGIEVGFTNAVEDFIKHSGAKITYTKQPLQNEFFVRSNDLLFEQGINDIPINVQKWEELPCFFSAGERSAIPFDIFSASFYLVSRYEEYLPHVKDIHGRYPANESLAHKNGFLQLPVVDLWAYKLLEKLQERFPDLQTPNQKYRYTSLIDVTTSHCYAHRGLGRSLAGLFLDLTSFKLKRFVERLLVWTGTRKDPYDNFEELIQIHRKYRTKNIFFFQFAEYSTYDKNISPLNNKFRFLIKYMADYTKISLCGSYSASRNGSLLKKEKENLATVIHRPVDASRIRYNRIEMPNTYRNLIEAEFTDDYTMGYTRHVGFRAGTCTPFYFYDIPLEVQQPIKIHPFAVHDYAVAYLKKEGAILEKLDTLYKQVKKVNGSFITVFSNELLGGDQRLNWLQVYETVIKRYHV